MMRSRFMRLGTGVGAALVVVLIAVVSGLAPSTQGTAQENPPPSDRRQRPPDRGPLTMSAKTVTLEISLGLKDKQQTRWRGQMKVSQGRVAKIEVVRSGNNNRITGNRFVVRHRRRRQRFFHPILRAELDAPNTATVHVTTEHGNFQFDLSKLPIGRPRTFLNGQVRVERLLPAFTLTGPETEDDFPVMARAKNGTAWLAYVEYQPGSPIIMERVRNREFDSLVPRGHGDCIRLVRLDGTSWQPPIDVTARGLDVWRPTVVVDGRGGVVVAWSQQVDGNWDIYFRRYQPPANGAHGKGTWSDIVRVTHDPGSDFHVVATTDASGTVWLAWQAWRGDNFDILLTRLADGKAGETITVSHSKANDWSPAIAADSKGNVFVAWDTYDRGNYDVLLRQVGQGRTIRVASSARFEVRPVLACDAEDRVWIAYEEGDEQWGKDYATSQFKRIPLEKNPGNGLYINRTIRVKCLSQGDLFVPAGNLQKAMGAARRNKSIARLAVDRQGGVWLGYRQHPLATGTGETWTSYVVRYNGAQWSRPQRLTRSDNLMDNRPAFLPFGDGMLAVYSGDYRSRTLNRQQDDLFACVLQPQQPTQSLALVPDQPTPKPQVPPVHENESADLQRIRSYTVRAGGKTLHLYRGEFHRHTEYTAHRDGDGTLEDSWRYALDAGNLDWMGNGDHDNGFGHEYMWWQIQKITDLFQNPPRFVAAYTYERSVRYPSGHRNVMFPRRGIRPLPRLSGNENLYGTADKGAPDVKLLFAYLKHFGGICASHTSGTNMGTDWRDNDPVVEPVVEIYQGHRHNYEHAGAPRSATAETHIGGYQPAGYVWNAFEKGIRFGFQSSSDHISTHMSYGVVLAEKNSRQAIIDAFKARHSYAATDNIILDIRCGDHIMGDIFETSDRPTLDIRVVGTKPIAKVHIIRDNKYVHTSQPNTREVSLRYTDMDARPGKTSYYYVRVEQADGNLAWASPMWITYAK